MRQHRRKNENKPIQRSEVVTSRLNWKMCVAIPTLVGTLLVLGFPEIVQFAQIFINQDNASETMETKKTDEAQNEPPASLPSPTLPPEISKFEPTYQKSLISKKIFLEGRRIAPVELSPQKNVSSADLRVYLFDDFLSAEECDGLRAAHDRHVTVGSKVPPLMCFESIDTLRKNLKDAKKSHIKVTSSDFTEGTFCLNSSFSSQVGRWLNENWSFSTSFYPGESAFSTKMAALIQETTGLAKENGGKFQITSYPLNIGYKKHTDCVLDNDDSRDRMATVLVYLDDVASGGETDFPELGIWVKPKKGRALIWNNMNADGKCLPLSIHQGKRVKEGHKYIIQRWYYYKSFWSLGRRVDPPPLPIRSHEQALVQCDEYRHGSCRWYDEWFPDVMEQYRSGTRI